MSRMLMRAKVKLENARHSLSKIDVDDAYMDDCCYNLQQSIEMILKAIVELNGEQYAENHDIRSKINILNKLGIEIPSQKELRNMASTIYSWETESRYRECFVALKDDINDALKIAEDLIKYADSLVNIVSGENLKDIPDKKL